MKTLAVRRGLLLLTALFGLGACSDTVTDAQPDGSDPTNGDPGAYDHRMAAGSSARDFLSDDDFDRLVVQVQYVEGFRPTEGGLQHLEDFLHERLNKPNGIELRVDDEPLRIEGQEEYTAEDVRALEEEHRTAYTEGTTLAAYLLFLDGEYSASANVVGLAYRNTSTVLFAEKIDENTGGLTQPSTAMVEGMVANHEFGHLLGLVDNGTAMQSDHRHEGHGKHCDVDSCLMYYAVRTTDFIANLTGDMPELDQNCLDDLRANGGK